MSDFQNRLENFLLNRNQPLEIEQLTPDASTREYFRVNWNGGSAIACVYPEPFVAADQSYLDVTNVFLTAGLPVAAIYDFDENSGVIVQEDLGNTILREVLENSDDDRRNDLIDDAIRMIARIQAATPIAFELGSIASKLKFDTEKLLWELNFFKTHYFETFKKEKLSEADDRALESEFTELASELETHATVLCHRDFHAANLMIDKAGDLRIIDHQDARIGSATYDLVSLLLDRIIELPTHEWLAEKRAFFLNERTKPGLDRLDENAFTYEFRLQTIQRCLKATGTFSYQSVNRGKTYFIPFIKPMLEIVLRAAENINRFPNLQGILKGRVTT